MTNTCISGLIIFSMSICMAACGNVKNEPVEKPVVDTPATITASDANVLKENPGQINTRAVPPDSILAFAKTLIGIPYLYASTDPAKGFDCSGFITYVFNHFKIAVPRSSVDFTNYGKEIAIEKAKPGDLVLFTGTDSTIRIVGHMGIVESVKEDIVYFIHSTSGKNKGVVITPFGDYYRSRFVKVIRIFPEEMFY